MPDNNELRNLAERSTNVVEEKKPWSSSTISIGEARDEKTQEQISMLCILQRRKVNKTESALTYRIKGTAYLLQ